MKIYYCWRCCQKMPFLEESEWGYVAPHLINIVADIKLYRQKNNVDLAMAMENMQFKAIEIFKEITGYNIIDPYIIFHHRLSNWGQECMYCGYLLRTPNTAFCAHCGHNI